MAIREVKFTVSSDLVVSPSAAQFAGVQGENNATTVVFEFANSANGGDQWELLNSGLLLYIEAITSVGGYDKTGVITVMDGRNRYIQKSIPLAWTQYGGVTTLRLVGEKDDVIVFTAEGKIRFDERQTAAGKVDSLLRGDIGMLIEECRESVDIVNLRANNAGNSAADAAASEYSAKTSAGQAAASEVSAGASAESAADSESEAKKAANNAEASASAAKSSAEDAANSATAAGVSAESAADSEAAVKANAESAEASATEAKASAEIATTSAAAAKADAESAEASKTAAGVSAENAAADAAAANEAAESAAASATEAKASAENVANALKGRAESAAIVTINDVSPLEHNLSVKVDRKNKIPFPYTQDTHTENGVTFTVNDDGSITINTEEGGATADTTFKLHGNDETHPVAIPDNLLVEGAPYTLSALNGTLTNGVALNINIYDKDGNSPVDNGVSINREKHNFNMPTSAITWYIRIIVSAGTVLTNYTVYPQIESGDDITEYETYVNFEDMTISQHGKNLFDADAILLAAKGWSVDGDGVYSGDSIELHVLYNSSSSNPAMSNFKPLTQYTLSLDAYADVTAGKPIGSSIAFSYTDGSSATKIQIDSATKERYTMVSKAGKTISKISFSYGYNIKNYFSNFQVEVGNKATGYEPYNLIATAPVEADGTVSGLVSQYPTTVLSADNANAIIECEYNRDLNKAYDTLVQAIISLGGNV